MFDREIPEYFLAFRMGQERGEEQGSDTFERWDTAVVSHDSRTLRLALGWQPLARAVSTL
jgi:hypothetical protein